MALMPTINGAKGINGIKGIKGTKSIKRTTSTRVTVSRCSATNSGGRSF